MAKRQLLASRSAQPTKCSNSGEVTFDDAMVGINSAINYFDTGGIDILEAIQHATTMLSELDDARANLLAIRAQALAKQAKFDRAITDMTKAIDTCPTSGQLYLLAGELHLAHGKPKLAIDVLENGLCSSPTSNWPSLYDGREAAKRLLEAKVDFVSVMPPEITATIFTCLRDMETANNELLICTMVSKKWRTAALTCSDLWRVAQYTGSGNGTFQLLSSVSSFVKELDFDDLQKKPFQKLVTLARHGMLQSTVRITLSFCRPRFVFSMVSALGMQLTVLKLEIISYTSQDDTLPLAAALATCKNLKALTAVLHQDYNSRYRQYQQPCVDIPNIEMLSIMAPYDECNFLYQLIPNCHQLRILNLARCPRDSLALVAEHLSQLEEFCLTDLDCACENIWMKEYKERKQPTTGLKRLEFGAEKGYIDLLGSTTLWTKWRNTLQEVDITIIEPQEDTELMEQRHWESLVIGPFPQLKSLRLVIMCKTNGLIANQISKLLQSSSALEDVSLDILDVLPNDFCTLFAGLPFLRRLEIGHLNESSGGLQQYFKYLSTHSQRCNLKEILINPSEAITDQDLFALAGIHSLERITIHGPCYLVSTSVIAMLLQRLKSNVNLQYLELSRMEYFTDACMPALDELVKLHGNGNRCRLQKFKGNSLVDPFRSHYDITFDVTKDTHS